MASLVFHANKLPAMQACEEQHDKEKAKDTGKGVSH